MSEKTVLPENDDVSFILNNSDEKLDLLSYEEEVLKPLNYLRQKPYLTTKIGINNLNYWLKIPREKLQKIEEILELIIDQTFM
jgi:hypothetical protein